MNEQGPTRHGSLEDLSVQPGTRLERHQSMLTLHAPTSPVPVPKDSTTRQVNVDLPNSNSGTVPTMADAEMADATAVRADLGYSYQQCSTARLASTRVDAVSLSLDGTFGKFIQTCPEVVSALNPPGDVEVLRTFHGARAARGDRMINQAVSLTMDPVNLMCITCKKEHVVPPPKMPGTVILCDQNFIPVWPGDGTCVPVVRVENASLHELVDMMFEIFEHKNLPDGTVLLVGTASYLHRVGSSIYCREWTQAVSRLSRRWPSIRVGPLVPVIREDCPGGMARELFELAAWFSKMYQGLANGMKGSWDKLIEKTLCLSPGTTPLASQEAYTVPLPSSLDASSPMVPTTFCCNTSRPSRLQGMDQGTIGEVLGSISSCLKTDFGIEVNLANATNMEGAQEKISKVVLIGASILKKVEPYLRDLGYEVANLCVSGWMATPETVSALLAQLNSLNLSGGTVLVFDLFGNSCYRFVEYDGSISRPTKVPGMGGHHLIGDVQLCSEQILSNLLEIVMPLLQHSPGTYRVIIPPQTRYLFNGCCKIATHCKNINSEKYQENLLASVLKMRAHVKKFLLGKLEKGFWLADSCVSIPEADMLSVSMRLQALRHASAPDGVHLTSVGCQRVALNLVTYFKGITNGTLGKNHHTSCLSTTSVAGTSRYSWHGISSPVGSSQRKQPGCAAHKHQRDRAHKSYLPYKRGDN